MVTGADHEIAERLCAIRARIANAARRAGRAPESVRLILATKTQSPQALRAAYAAGARDFGENYVQEAVAKRAQLADLTAVAWHMIGHLQSNKARLAVETFDLIQGLDSERLANALDRVRPIPPVPVLIEVNLGGEAAKGGVAPEQVERLLDSIRTKVEVRGLMAIPPAVEKLELARPAFSALFRLREKLAASTGIALSELSMGMTDDFEVAIEEGATMVRIGRAVFGERTK